MTYEEALKHIKKRMELYIHSTEDNFALHTALEAVEKQIPKKVVAHQNCPNCDEDVIGSGYYCWNCGQKLEW